MAIAVRNSNIPLASSSFAAPLRLQTADMDLAPCHSSPPLRSEGKNQDPEMVLGWKSRNEYGFGSEQKAKLNLMWAHIL